MAVTVCGIERGSAAERSGIKAGDVLLSVNGYTIHDVLDYRFYIIAPKLTLSLRTAQGEEYRVMMKKREYDDPGLEFETYLMDRQRFCKNRCVFCFIDQLPKGMRESLYFKDDDSRMSFLFGNYITLTNLEEWDIRRIIAMHISPVNVSVHTTSPELRVQMMANPHAGDVLEYLPRLTEAGIRVNAQMVLCPGINDGEELERSLRDLTALAPNLQSVAVVPVGLTRHREGLSGLRLFTRQEAGRVLDTINAFGDRMLERHEQRICYAADEFYLCAGREIPEAAFYEDFTQLENGVGLLSLLTDEFCQALEETEPCPVVRRVSIATGTAAASTIAALAERAMERFSGLQVEVIPVNNDFFGHTITVAGLVTGGDLLSQLAHRELGDVLLFPAVMLRHERDLFLDDVPVERLEEVLGVPAHPVENNGYDLLDAILGRPSE